MVKVCGHPLTAPFSRSNRVQGKEEQVKTHPFVRLSALGRALRQNRELF